MSARLKVLGGATAFARWYAQVENGPTIPRPADLPHEPYRFSDSIFTYVDQHGRAVVCLEVRHNRYEIWSVTP